MEPTKFREEWLHNATEVVGRMLNEMASVTVPEVRVSTGWPSKGGTSLKKRVIGQCWKPEATKDGIGQVFISPTLETGYDVLGVLVHELIHAVHPEAKHAGKFIETAKAVGLTGKWTATVPGEDLEKALRVLAEELGPYPHSPIIPTIQIPVQTTRMLKLECKSCGYIVRTTQKWVDAGLPSCPEGDEMEVEVKP